MAKELAYAVTTAFITIPMKILPINHCTEEGSKELLTKNELHSKNESLIIL